MERVGIRELRQNLSVQLRRIKRGESLEVTEHGRPIAVLAPLPESGRTTERLRAAGKLMPATSTLASLRPPAVSAQPSTAASDALAEQRSERL